MAWRYLDLVDFLLIAEAVLDIPAEDLARARRLELAESALHAPAAEFGGVEFYPDPARKAAVLASRLIGDHPLPDGNKRVG
jgi:death on curing protein